MTCIPPLDLPDQIRRVFTTFLHIRDVLSGVCIVPMAETDGDGSVRSVKGLEKDEDDGVVRVVVHCIEVPGEACSLYKRRRLTGEEVGRS